MKHVRHKVVKRKGKKPRRNLNTSSSSQLPPLPQHILDQIPPGATLRPNSSSMRQMAAQRMASNFLPLPFNLTPQQQQVQNMRNNNDLKENAINQAKQDMINENERKRSLQKQEVDAKRENLLFKHNLDSEKQQFDQQQKLADERHKLNIANKELKFKKQLVEGDNAIRRQRLLNEQQQALIEQAKYENEKLKNKYETDDLNNRFKQYKQQYDDISAQNEALKTSIEKFNTDDFINGYNELIENISVAKAHNRVLTSLREAQNKIIEERLISMTEPTEQQIEAQYNDMKTDIEGKQAALVEQIKHKQDIQEKIDRFNNLRSYKQKLITTTDNLQNETEELTKLKNSIGNIDDNVKKIIHNKVDAEVKRDIEKEMVDNIKSRNEALTQHFILEERNKLMNSDEYQHQQQRIIGTKAITDQLKLRTQQFNEAIKAHDEAYRAEQEKVAHDVALDARLNGSDSIEVLKGQIETIASPTKAAAIHKQIAAQAQLMNQEETQRVELAHKLINMLDAEVGDSSGLSWYGKDKGFENREDFEELIKSSNYETLKGMWDEYNRGPQE